MSNKNILNQCALYENLMANHAGVKIMRDIILTIGRCSINFKSELKKRDLSKNLGKWYFATSDLSIQPLNVKG